ncbi:DNA polymerase III subunit gamma/tau [Microbacter margulisiae]|uniref:DNA polymerase III subunit gamma/tau n=1 Tax=Microbacter margulisiae TaxID=1350067 RepID=A0A7W5H1I9_9PORP|nr:DNA polymerase III subunit gamma/tau [Microbacter margulisiae]MBB3186422.1 DNA polymerase-3 subunit gamma/tau [Microbacter margulisiae]
MNNFIVSARKYRPTTFESVVGQSALTATLKNAIKTNHLAHAYLFCGPRGVGKTSCARIFAKTINCEHLTPEFEACNECESCRTFNEQRSYNIHELDAASNNSVDDIRSLIDQVRIPPQIGNYSVYIIDEVHMLSQAAFNAFLKTLEEPPAHAIFILATTEKHKIIPTILSRCQIYDFVRIGINDIVEHLASIAEKEGITAEPEALNVIAQKADGGMRDALSIFDQVVSFCSGNITYQAVIENLNVLDYDYYFRLTDCFLSNRVADALLLFNEILNKGFDAQNFVTGMSGYFRDLLMCKNSATVQLLEMGNAIRELYVKQAAQCNPVFLFDALTLSNECDLNFRTSRNKRLLTELLLIRLCQWNDKKKVVTDETVEHKSIEKIRVSSPAPAPTLNNTQLQNNVVATQYVTTHPSSSIGRYQEPVQKKQAVVPPSISIRTTPQEITQMVTENQAGEYKVKQHEPVSPEALQNAWLKFANDKIADQIYARNYMLNHLPTLTGSDSIRMVFDQPIQQKSFSEIFDNLKIYLLEELRNDFLTFEFELDETQQDDNALFTSQDRYTWLQKKNDALTHLRKTFKLELD